MNTYAARHIDIGARHGVWSRIIAQQRINKRLATATIAIFLRAGLPRNTFSYTERIHGL